MAQKFDVADGIFVKAFGPDEMQDPIVYIIFDDYPDTQSVPIYAHKIKAMIAALTDAAVWLADQVGDDNASL